MESVAAHCAPSKRGLSEKIGARHHKSENTVTICESGSRLGYFKCGRRGYAFCVGVSVPQERGPVVAGLAPLLSGNEGKAVAGLPPAALLSLNVSFFGTRFSGYRQSLTGATLLVH